MTIFVDKMGQTSTLFSNFIVVSGDTGGTGLDDVPGDTSVFILTYESTPGQPTTADRLDALVNTDFGVPIVATALNGGNDPYSGGDVTGNAWVFVDSSSGSDIIRVVCDVSQCCGSGIHTFDVGGNLITTPNPVILYHELSHAFRGAQGTLQPNDEPPATADENVMRTQLGLCLRDVNNHAGQCGGSASTCGGGDGGIDAGPPAGGCAAGNDGGCFIVTATTGSPDSAEVILLRGLRDRVAGSSALAARLIDQVYRDYAMFSPAIADELAGNGFARQAVLRAVVRPLLAWYSLAGTLAFRHADADAVRAALDDLARSTRGVIGSATLRGALQALASGESLQVGMLGRFGRRVQMAARLRFASWAILDPLTRLWQTAGGKADPVDEVAAWLASAPLEAVAHDVDPAHAEQDVAELARLFDFRPEVRPQLGARLRTAWPQASKVLRRHGFIEVEDI